jgi:hypothetical protein
MNARLGLAVAAVSVGVVSLARAQTTVLSCSGDEASALRVAPHGAERVSPHRLAVTWARGIAEFADSGTEAGTIGGTAYRYCAFSATAGVHLIQKNAGDLFTGVLLDQATGRTLRAGQEVSFAPDGRHYFAWTQQDGVEGQEWYVYARNGALVWRGVSLIIQRIRGEQYRHSFADLSEPRWSGSGRLQATVTCENGPTQPPGTVTLTRSRVGWAWRPAIKCERHD